MPLTLFKKTRFIFIFLFFGAYCFVSIKELVAYTKVLQNETTRFLKYRNIESDYIILSNGILNRIDSLTNANVIRVNGEINNGPNSCYISLNDDFNMFNCTSLILTATI